jgi:hypothetical protein
MRFYLEKLCTSPFVAWLLGLMVAGHVLMIVESSWVSVVTVKYLWNDKKPFFG